MTVSNFLFHAGVKAGFYAFAGTSQAAGMAIWAYEETTGQDVPFLLQVSIQAGTPVAMGVIHETAELQFKRHAKDMTWHVTKKAYGGVKGGSRIMLHGTKKAAGLSARAFARGGAMMMTRVGLRFVPVAGWVLGGYEIIQFLRSESGKLFLAIAWEEYTKKQQPFILPIYSEPFRMVPREADWLSHVI